MAKNKTQATSADVETFLNSVADEQKREDAFALLKLMKQLTKEPPRMWGATMVGFGQYHYVYASGHEGDSFLAGFSPRKEALTVYLMAGVDQRFSEQLKKLGKAKTSKGCLYIKKLADVDLVVLREMIAANVACLKEMSQPKTSDPKGKKKHPKHGT